MAYPMQIQGIDAAGNEVPLRLSADGALPTIGSNVSNVFRDACEIYPNADTWETAQIGAGDFILARGNTAGAGWIEISKDPSAKDTETVLTMRERFTMPLKLTTMVSMTHRNAGEQIFSQEFVSDDAAYGGEPVPTPAPVEILDASQTTITITINFAAPPAVPFRIGQVVSVYGFTDTRLNVNSCTVASTPTPTQITVVGNDYAFTSATIASTLGNGEAYIERVDLLGGARNGVAIVRGNAAVTNARDYVRAQGGLAKPSGALAGAHNFTSGADAAVALAGVAPYSEAWGVPLETILFASRDGVIHADRGPDANWILSSRFRQSQVVPNPDRPYLLRFRLRSTPSLTRPVARIVSISKAGSTTTTIVTDVPHECVTGQYVGFYGAANQTNFANHSTGLPCTVVDANTLTVVHGALATATSYGGFLTRVHGQQALGGAIAQVAQSVARTGNIVTLTGNAAWAAPTSIGNIVQLIGVRDTVDGADLGLDGAYVVRNLVTTVMTLEPVAGFASAGADIASTPCGGGVVQRMGARIHGVTSTDFNPMMVEPAFKGVADQGEAQAINGAVTVTTVTNAGTPTAPATPYILNSAASTNGALILTGSSGLHAFYATNTGATNAFVKLYNKATAPTVGTDVPAVILPVPAAVSGVPGAATLPIGYQGFRFALGLGIAITGSVADNDTTAVAAGQVKVMLSRTI